MAAGKIGWVKPVSVLASGHGDMGQDFWWRCGVRGRRPHGAVVGTALGHAADNGSLLETPVGGWTDRWGPRLNADPNGAATFIAAKMRP